MKWNVFSRMVSACKCDKSKFPRKLIGLLFSLTNTAKSNRSPRKKSCHQVSIFLLKWSNSEVHHGEQANPLTGCHKTCIIFNFMRCHKSWNNKHISGPNFLRLDTRQSIKVWSQSALVSIMHVIFYFIYYFVFIRFNYYF